MKSTRLINENDIPASTNVINILGVSSWLNFSQGITESNEYAELDCNLMHNFFIIGNFTLTSGGRVWPEDIMVQSLPKAARYLELNGKGPSGSEGSQLTSKEWIIVIRQDRRINTNILKMVSL